MGLWRGRSGGDTEYRTPDGDRGDGRVQCAGAGQTGGNSQPLVDNFQSYGGTYGEGWQMDGRGQRYRDPFFYI